MLTVCLTGGAVARPGGSAGGGDWLADKSPFPSFRVLVPRFRVGPKLIRAGAKPASGVSFPAAPPRVSETLCRGETHVFVHCTLINLMKEPNKDTLIFLVSA